MRQQHVHPPDPTACLAMRRCLLAPRSVVAAALTAHARFSLLQAVIKGYEPMPGLEGKDYGKSRMT